MRIATRMRQRNDPIAPTAEAKALTATNAAAELLKMLDKVVLERVKRQEEVRTLWEGIVGSERTDSNSGRQKRRR